MRWTEPALLDQDEIAEYIALDDPAAASRYVRKVFDRVKRLEAHPKSGKCPSELPRTHYREIVIPPCRLFYRIEKETVYILYVMRSEKLMRDHMLEERNSGSSK